MTLDNKAIKALVKAQAKSTPDTLNTELETHVLTDKDEIKIVGCRTCKRPCVVTRFASAAKTACNDHKDRHVEPEVIRGFDRSKETHVLTDRDKTKEVPCRTCGRPCVVTTFAAPLKVACNDCRGSVPRPTKRTSMVKRNGRFREETTIQVFDSHQAQWSNFVISCPIIDSVWTQDEYEKNDKLRLEQCDAMAAAGKARRKRIGAEAELYGKVVHVDREAELNAIIQKADAEEQEFNAAATRLRAERDVFGRRAFIRGATAAGWEVRINGHALITKNQVDVPLPDDYLPLPDLRQLVN